MRRTLLIALTALIAAIVVGTAQAQTFTARSLSDTHVGTSKAELQAQMHYSDHVVRSLKRPAVRWKLAPRHATCWSHVPWAHTCNRARTTLIAHRRLYAVAKQRYDKLYAPKPVFVVSGAAGWYADGATQCEVDHEGGFTSVSPYGYAGRFQMDYSFETSTSYGRQMEAQYGRANNWPESAQIQHAYEVWLSRGWSPWPPYYKYGCASYHGRSYS